MDNNEQAVFGGGFFWCTEAVFKLIKGVKSVEPGYAGGYLADPTYEQVSSGTTGHAEVIRISYDPKLVQYKDLLTVFFATHDPTTLNQQGNDVGTQYRSVILTVSNHQRVEAENYIRTLNGSTHKGNSIVTEVKPLKKFYSAENYHKDYFSNHSSLPYCQVVINPKLDKVKADFKKLLA